MHVNYYYYNIKPYCKLPSIPFGYLSFMTHKLNVVNQVTKSLHYRKAGGPLSKHIPHIILRHNMKYSIITSVTFYERVQNVTIR
jgi:hypothetical protein